MTSAAFCGRLQRAPTRQHHRDKRARKVLADE